MSVVVSVIGRRSEVNRQAVVLKVVVTIILFDYATNEIDNLACTGKLGRNLLYS